MPHVLHLVKDPTNAVALDAIRAHAADPVIRLSVVLMQDAAAHLAEPLPAEVYRLTGSHDTVPPTPGSRAIGPSELLDLIFTADSVVTW